MSRVTGAAGFLGNHAARLLLERGETVSTAWAWVTAWGRGLLRPHRRFRRRTEDRRHSGRFTFRRLKPRPAALGYLLASG